ncbi:E3 ubiquitin-protein ligase NEURL1-like isoform X2 [Vanacampus margaritifer]
MGGQITKHDNAMFGSVPISTLPSGTLHLKHSYDCSHTTADPQFFSHHHHHHHHHQSSYKPTQCSSDVNLSTSSLHNKHSDDCSHTTVDPQSFSHYHHQSFYKPTQCPSDVNLSTSSRHSKHTRFPAYEPCLPHDEPLLFHPTAKGSQIVMDESQRMVNRKGSFCNAIVFSDRCVAVNEVVRLKITQTHRAWQGALRIGFTTQDPSKMNPKTLPRYSCPDLASRSDFWAKPLPEELLNNEAIISFWVSKKGRVLYRINESTPKRLFRQVSCLPLWFLVDVYGKTRGVQLLESETLSSKVTKVGSTRRLMLPKKTLKYQVPVTVLDIFEDGPDEDDHEEHQCPDHMPQNVQNLRLCSELPEHLEDELQVHYVHGVHVRLLDPHTVETVQHQGPDRTLVFTSRPLQHGEIVSAVLQSDGPAQLSYGVTTCDPAMLKPQEMPSDLAWLQDRLEFWALDRLSAALMDEDVLSFEVSAAGEVVASRNGASLGVRLYVDNSRPLWMFFAPHKNITQLRIFGSDAQGPLKSPSSVPSRPRSPLSMTNAPATNTPTESNVTIDRLLNSSRVSSTGSSQATIPLVQSLLNSSSSAVNVPNVGLPSKRHNRFSPPPSVTEPQQNSPPASPSSPSSAEESDKCAICWDDTANTALYDCGHLCLCFACALTLKQEQKSCPICRKPILDIIKTYRST